MLYKTLDGKLYKPERKCYVQIRPNGSVQVVFPEYKMLTYNFLTLVDLDKFIKSKEGQLAGPYKEYKNAI